MSSNENTMSKNESVSDDASSPAEFNFDSEEHWGGGKTPAIKALNQPAALWIADENADICSWTKECLPECKDNCSLHFASTSFHGLSRYGKTINENEPLIISGRIITKPRFLVINRSPLLLVNKGTGRGMYTQPWFKGYNKDIYQCVRRYLLLFVTEDNVPLHGVPLQFTAKGYCQVEFDRCLMDFRTLMVDSYNVEKRTHVKDNFATWTAWHSMMIFTPTFKSELRGPRGPRGPSKDKQSPACITTSSTPISANNWTSHTIGRNEDTKNKELRAIVFRFYNENKVWWKKSFKKESLSEEQEDAIDFVGLSID